MDYKSAAPHSCILCKHIHNPWAIVLVGPLQRKATMESSPPSTLPLKPTTSPPDWTTLGSECLRFANMSDKVGPNMRLLCLVCTTGQTIKALDNNGVTYTNSISGFSLKPAQLVCSHTQAANSGSSLGASSDGIAVSSQNKNK